MLAVLGVVAALACPAAEPRLTDEMWAEARPVYEKTLAHPFLRGLAGGTLPRSRFRFYLVQDSHYLRVFARVLSALAAKAPRADWARTLDRRAAATLRTEQELHGGLLRSFGVAPEAARAAPMAPTAYAYGNHLLAAALGEPFAYGLAAALPCYRIYWEAGQELKKRGSPDPGYQRWINTYAGAEFGQVVRKLLEMMDEAAAGLDAEARRAVRQRFAASVRYEYLFWDMAWREETWQP